MTEDEKVYKEAMSRMDEMVEEIIELCNAIADDNHYEREWVLESFRSKFNRAKRKELK